ncbi:RNA-guided endonuclease InsQ/TnpB family protein [Streptomyces justiciae]|uniref:RNA-guided endonuclease InsQ/TnpB family protein n=1 Tax=Streptomyces justiciae TaxID=2780140 RepID=UPI002AD41FB3|nr:transposase [Streptomyces justiciae]
MKHVAFTGEAEQLATVAEHRQGESDLLCQGGQWYLLVTCEIAEAEPNVHPVGFVGVDLGIVNIATTSTGTRHSGRRINRTREQDRKLRAKLQKKNTKSAKRRAKKHAGKEARRARDINHKISKCIVAEAQRTARGITLEDLGGIRSRECSRCHHMETANRPSQATFTCRSCGFAEHADHNASHNISHRGWWTWVRGAESQAPALTLIA